MVRWSVRWIARFTTAVYQAVCPHIRVSSPGPPYSGDAISRLCTLSRQSLDFHVQYKSSKLLQLLERTQEVTAHLVRWTASLLVDRLLKGVLVCAISFWAFDWRYVAMMLACAAAYAGLGRKTQSRIDPICQEVFRHADQAEQCAGSYLTRMKRACECTATCPPICAVDSIINCETIKHFGAEQFEMQRLHRLLLSGSRASFSLEMARDLQFVVMDVAATLLMLALLLMCVVDISAGRMTPGTFFVLFNYAGRIRARVFRPHPFLFTTHTH